MPYHLKPSDSESSSDIITPAPDFKDIGPFKGAVVTVNNLVARATTRWTLEESKLFMTSVSKIDTRDEHGWVRMSKNAIVNLLGLDPRNTNKLRAKLQGVRKKSDIVLEGPNADDWEEGALITATRTDRNYAYVQFNLYYLPLLQYMKGELFTRFDLSSIMGFSHKSAYNLYLYLASWHDPRYMINKRNIAKSQIPKVFNLKEGQYWRKYGQPDQKFDWPYFEKRCLIPAIEDINNNPECDLYIDYWEKAKSPENKKTILGYQFQWHYQNPDGTYKLKGQSKSETKDDAEVLDYNHADRFMKHFRKLADEQLQQLVNMLEVRHPFGDLYTVAELKELQKSECTDKEFVDCLNRSKADVIVGTLCFNSEKQERFESLLGYPIGQNISDLDIDLEAMEKILESKK